MSPYPPPPPAGYPHYPYPPPGYGPYPGWRLESKATADAKEKGDVIPYEDGHEIPFGYHRDTRLRSKGLAVGGAAMLGTGWGVAALFGGALWGESSRTPWGALVVPVAGPFIVMAAADFNELEGLFLYPLLLTNGLLQTGGLIMLIVGVQSRDVLVRDGAALQQPITPRKPELIVGPGSIGMKMHF